jgi:diacylglycerol kinase family enzyme
MRKTFLSSLEGKKVSCIINPSAANKKWKRKKLLRKFLQENLPGQIIDSHEDKNHTVQTAKELSRNNDIIVAAGGDGTIADVIQGITASENSRHVALGIIPLGSGNAFRKSLGIPKNIKKSIQLIAEGRPQEIDLMDLEGTKAAFGSIGAVAQVTKEKMSIAVPGLWGHIIAAKILPKVSSQYLEIELFDGRDDKGKPFNRKTLRLNVYDCVVSKTKHFGYGWKIAPKANLDDGYIDIGFFETTGLRYMLYFPFIYFGLFQKTQKHFKAKRTVLRGKNLHIQYHGELLGIKDQVDVKILPRALKIITPQKKSF